MFFHVAFRRWTYERLNSGVDYLDWNGGSPDVDVHVNGVHPVFSDEILRSTNGNLTEWMDGWWQSIIINAKSTSAAILFLFPNDLLVSACDTPKHTCRPSTVSYGRAIVQKYPKPDVDLESETSLAHPQPLNSGRLDHTLIYAEWHL